MTTLHRQISSEDNLTTSIFHYVKDRINIVPVEDILYAPTGYELKPARLVSLTISAEHRRSLLSDYRTTFSQVFILILIPHVVRTIKSTIGIIVSRRWSRVIIIVSRLIAYEIFT